MFHSLTFLSNKQITRLVVFIKKPDKSTGSFLRKGKTSRKFIRLLI
ncbi:hypothetical protein HMPREF2531_03561 [Bacteroides intestinalis]|uniref:Uncharacterized protein n=1 Tax=Bacteroides intestinalis TaxID=329854 RepID=A0A139L1U1_9BACE|nr:hypothetical protein HMPREF2531_03561 [Bacteroides intestinalis]